MRYIGNKTRILPHIDKLISDKQISGGVFADLFTGTGSVADHFKDRFEIISNDMLKYASIFSKASIKFSTIPKFDTFYKKYGKTPFSYWNEYDYTNVKAGFVTLNFSPVGGRQFFQRKNAIKIDEIRRNLDSFKQKQILNEDEYCFLLASLLESVMRVSNTSGTYEAFFKKWESRSKKDFVLKPLTIETRALYSNQNQVYNCNANELVKKISGNVAYIDTPYTITQYASAYHVLETISLNDNPEIRGRTGRRVNRKMSDYSKKRNAKTAFADLLAHLQFKHVIISYSNQAIIPLDEFIVLVKTYAQGNQVEVRKIDFQEYKNLNTSQKGKGKQLQEVLLYYKALKS